MEIFTILANLILLNFISAQIMSKCCPMNYELFINASNLNNISRHDVFCRPTNGTVLLALNSPSLTIGLPNCSKLNIIDVYRRDLKISCLDRITQLNDVFAIRCAENETENVHDIVNTANVRKCCPSNRKFDWDKQYCWNQHAEDYPNAVTDLIKLAMLPNRENQFVNLSYGLPHCKKSDVLMDKMIHWGDIEFLNTDSILINQSNKAVIFSFDEFCVDLVDERFEYLVIRSCHDYMATCKHGDQTCIRKCCPVGYELSGEECIPSERPLSLSFHNLTERGSSIVSNIKPAFLQGSGCTRGKYQLNESEQEKHIMTTSGTVFALATNTVMDVDMYCIDNVKYQRTAKIFVCLPEAKSVLSIIRELKPALTSICAAISAFFFILTFFIYLLIPSLRNLHGQLIMSYLIASAASYIMVVIHRTLPLHILSEDLCKAAGYALLFTTLSSFCWLNIISFDIWSTFKITRSTFLKKSKTYKRLLIYSLYGWGYPMIWSTFTYGSQFIFNKDDKLLWISDIGKVSCWFSDYGRSKIIYFILPISIMLIFNAIIFITIVKYCSSVRAELYNTNNCNYSLRRYSMNKNDFVINVKLFILMGLNWSLEVIALVVQPQHRVFFIISDLLNALVGLIVFSILIMKRKVLHDLKKLMCGSGWRQGNLDRTTRSNVSTSSSNVQSVTNSRRSVNRF